MKLIIKINCEWMDRSWLAGTLTYDVLDRTSLAGALISDVMDRPHLQAH